MSLIFESLTAATMALSQPIAAPDPSAPPSLCQLDETTILSGAVQDDFGLDVAVCLSGEEDSQILTIRWSGEGGNDSLSCKSNQCDGLIEYSRHTSPHLTILQIAWIKGGNFQRLYQTLQRSSLAEEAIAKTTHSWEHVSTSEDSAQIYPVLTDNEPLALMRLESVIQPKLSHLQLLAQPQP